jgi:hypothetical protein
MADAALGDPNAFGKLLLGDIEFLDPFPDQGYPFVHIHRRHDTDCLPAFNTHQVVFVQTHFNTLGIRIELHLSPIGIRR